MSFGRGIDDAFQTLCVLLFLGGIGAGALLLAVIAALIYWLR